MTIVRIQVVQADLEPQELEVPDGLMPEMIHEVSKLRERKYKHEHFKTAITINGTPAEKWLEQNKEGSPVSDFILTNKIEQVALRLVDTQETA